MRSYGKTSVRLGNKGPGLVKFVYAININQQLGSYSYVGDIYRIHGDSS